MSRVTLCEQKAILRDEIVKMWDRHLDMSRATLKREIGHLLGHIPEKVGEDGPRNSDCHGAP